MNRMVSTIVSIFDMLGWHLVAPFLGTSFYLGFPKEMLFGIPVGWTNWFALVHNMGISVFSIWTCYQLSYHGLYTMGVHTYPQYYASNPWINRVVFYFYLSKYYEYVDTLLIYAKNREPIFLQTFHHVGAPVVWHLSYVYGCDGGGFFASLFNSFVHSFMYAYYALVLCKIDAIRKYKIYLTSLQLMQLGFGGFLMHTNYNTVAESGECRAVMTLFNGYICTLIYLFGEFMISTYGWRAIYSLFGRKVRDDGFGELVESKSG